MSTTKEKLDLLTILRRAMHAYCPDKFGLEYPLTRKDLDKVGDTLAKFVWIELQESSDEGKESETIEGLLAVMINRMDNAQTEIEQVADYLRSERTRLQEGCELVECNNCGETWTREEFDRVGVDFANIPDLMQRIEPGEEVPYGECPDCGALVHLIEGKGSDSKTVVVPESAMHEEGEGQ